MALGRHFRVDELAQTWRISRRKVIQLIDDYMRKVPTIGRKRSRFGPIKRPYVVRLVPEAIVRKIYKDLFQR